MRLHIYSRLIAGPSEALPHDIPVIRQHLAVAFRHLRCRNYSWLRWVWVLSGCRPIVGGFASAKPGRAPVTHPGDGGHIAKHYTRMATNTLEGTHIFFGRVVRNGATRDVCSSRDSVGVAEAWTLHCCLGLRSLDLAPSLAGSRSRKSATRDLSRRCLRLSEWRGRDERSANYRLFSWPPEPQPRCGPSYDDDVLLVGSISYARGWNILSRISVASDAVVARVSSAALRRHRSRHVSRLRAQPWRSTSHCAVVLGWCG